VVLLYPSEDGLDVLCLATLVYLADTRISRTKHSQDGWTREINITLPVYHKDTWQPVSGTFARMLNFLTGDRWNIEFSKREALLPTTQLENASFDAVALFSGGMDSLISTINHLANSRNIVMISHAGDSFTKNAQRKLMAELGNKYPDNRPTQLNLWMTFGKDIIPNGGAENSTRSRSFLFIAFGIFALSGMKGVTSLQVPENGLIALNVPLDDLRIGSHSTRTTHPFYLNLWNTVLNELGLPYQVENPYWNKTKGEMAAECLNKNFLLQTMSISTSCAHPSGSRWTGHAPQHCGYCVPCIIRRAAMHKAYGFQKDTTPYLDSSKSLSELMKLHAKGKGEQLRSFQIAIKRITSKPELRHILVYKSGRLDGSADDIEQLADVYYRGLLEVSTFINDYLAYENGEISVR
jgi:7-cyano-7-deazaguanine synthase in queuosine biosynthesis